MGKRLKRWEGILTQHESYLFDLEAEIMAVEDGEVCDCCEDSEDDDEDWPSGSLSTVSNQIAGGVRRSAVLAVNPGDEVNFLEKLYSLSDNRRKQ
jgi:hypothetical protein